MYKRQLLDALDDALVRTAARLPIDLMRTNNTAHNEAVARELSRLVKERDLGVSVDRCDVKVRAPLALQDAFDRVLTAQVASSTALSQARNYRTTVSNQANQLADALVNRAEADRKGLVDRTAGEASRFQELLPQYQANPELLLQQRYNEVISRVISNAQERVFLASRPDGQPRELRLLLNRDPNRDKSKPLPQP